MIRSFCLTLFGSITAAGALAQTAAPVATAAGDTGTLAELVVTARKYSENLQDVPIAVTALSAATIETQDVTNLEDLNSFAPNFKIAADRATSSTINVYIRGVGQSDPLWGFDPGVGVYIDDVYLARPQTALLDVIDVQDLEILRGPQGTLYGKNTIAGAIKYTSREIDGPMSLIASVTGGNYGEHDEKLYFSTPVIEDHVYFGVALADLQHDGYGHVVAQPGTPTSPYQGEDVSNKDVLAARANLTIKWGESSKLKILADDILDNSNAAGGQRLNDYLVPALGNPFDIRTDMPVNRDYTHRSGESATYTQSLTDQLGLKVIAAYVEGRSQQFINFSELNENLFEVPGAYHDQQASGEGQLTFKNELVNAVGGLFYMDSTACGSYNASIGTLGGILPPAVSPDLGLFVTELVSGCVLTKSYAVYGDTAWKLTDKLDLDAGVRWNDDQKNARVYQADYASVAPAQLLPGQQFFNAAAVPAGFFNFPGVVTDYTGIRSFVNVTPRLGVDYHWTDHVMTYVSYSRGFKSGGFDMRGNAAVYPDTKNGYASETADNYEAGLKSTLFDDRLLLNLTVFYDPYRNAQIQLQDFVEYAGAPTNLTAVLNAGKQINEGVELESAWRPTKALTVSLNLGYLDSYYKNFLVNCSIFTLAVGCTGGGVLNLASTERPLDAPMWSISPNVTYTFDLAGGSLLTRAGYDWRSFTKTATYFPSPTDQPAYGVLNAGVAFTTANKAWRFSIDAKNLTDRYYRVAGYDFGGPPIAPANIYIGGVSQIGFYGPPRTYAATVTYHF